MRRTPLISRSIIATVVSVLCVLAAPTAAAQAPAPAKAVTLMGSLKSPWGLAFLPDGRMLVTEKGGRLLLVAADGKSVISEIGGLPQVAISGQGGLLGIAIDPDFEKDPWVYWAYTEAGTGDEDGLTGTALARGRLAGTTLRDIKVLFRQAPKFRSGVHFGARIVFRGDKTLFLTLGDRGNRDAVQDPKTGIGKVIRLNRDGTVPTDNPRVTGGLPEVWSTGHRNIQGAALHPADGALWAHEHGPQGGDELNRVVPGGNYGWPIASYGCPYGVPEGDRCRIGGGKHPEGYREPVSYWVPQSIAPAGLIFYSGKRFPEWKGDAFIGALRGQALWRVRVENNRETARERLFAELKERIRDVAEGPDGWIYLLTDGGKLIRIER